LISSALPAAYQSLDPRNCRLEQVLGLIFAAVVGVIAMVALAITALAMGRLGPVWIAICVGALLIIASLFTMACVWPRLQHRHTGWRLDETGLEIRRGVLWRHQVTIPVARVQHTDVSQGPLQRQYELGTVTIHTAGTQNASVMLSGLTHSTAVELRDQLIAHRGAADVV
jgi:hypothetical protein